MPLTSDPLLRTPLPQSGLYGSVDCCAPYLATLKPHDDGTPADETSRHSEESAIGAYKKSKLEVERLKLTLKNLEQKIAVAKGSSAHNLLVTALESNDPQLVLDALQEHGGQRYLRFRREAPVGVAPVGGAPVGGAPVAERA